MKRRFGWALAATSLASLTIAASASAALTTAADGNTLRVFSNNPGEQNSARVEIDDDEGLIFTDSEAGAQAGFCPVVADDIVCGNDLNGFSKIRFELSGGNDSFATFDPRLIGLAGLRVLMGPGEDQVFTLAPVNLSLGPGNDAAALSLVADKADGGEGNDLIFGGTGDDVLKGGPGNDKLDGGFQDKTLEGFGDSDGRDTFIGGPGRDKILAKDFTKDRKIDCGPGRDKVKRDRFDPKPKNC